MLSIVIGIIACSTTPTNDEYSRWDMCQFIPLQTSLEETTKMYTAYLAIEPLCFDSKTGVDGFQSKFTLTECTYDIGDDEALTLHFISKKLIMARHIKGDKVYTYKLDKVVRKLHTSLL